jgi:hypothetical protein
MPRPAPTEPCSTGACAFERLQVMLPGHGHALDVVEEAIVALEDQRVDRRQAAPALGIGGDAVADLRDRHLRHRKRIRQRDRRLQHPEFGDLHQADALAEAVEHDGGGGHAVTKQVAAMRPHHRHAGLHRPLVQRAVAHGDAGDIGDGVAAPGRQAADTRQQGLRCGRSWGRAHRASRRRAG